MSDAPSEMTIEGIVLKRLAQLVRPLDRRDKIMRFPLVFNRVCTLHCLKKREAWAVLRRLESQGNIEIVPYQGIRLVAPDAEGRVKVMPTSWRPTSRTHRRVLAHLKTHGRAYPSDIARALNLDIDTVMNVARRLQREGLIDT